MAEIFDDNLSDYQNKLAHDDMEPDDETLNCDLYNKSNCCEAHFQDETDVCTECLEHAYSYCKSCEFYNECNNPNKSY